MLLGPHLRLPPFYVHIRTGFASGPKTCPPGKFFVHRSNPTRLQDVLIEMQAANFAPPPTSVVLVYSYS